MISMLQLAWTHNPIQPSCASLEGTSCAFADYQPNKAPPLSSVAVAAEGDCITADGPKPQSTPQALDTAGIARASISFLSSVDQLRLNGTRKVTHKLQTLADMCICKLCHFSGLVYVFSSVTLQPLIFENLASELLNMHRSAAMPSPQVRAGQHAVTGSVAGLFI